MSINVEIEPTLEAALNLRAQAAGLSLEAYVRSLVARDVQTNALEPRVETSVRLASSLRGKLGQLPNGALEQESIYDGR